MGFPVIQAGKPAIRLQLSAGLPEPVLPRSSHRHTLTATLWAASKDMLIFVNGYQEIVTPAPGAPSQELGIPDQGML